MRGTVIHIEQTDIRTPTSRPGQRPAKSTQTIPRRGHCYTSIQSAIRTATHPSVHPPIHPFRGLKWRSSQATPRDRTRPLDPIYPTISDRRKHPLPSSTTGGDKVQLASTSQQSRRHTSLLRLAPGPCRAAQRRAVRHEVLLVPLTDRPARVTPCSTASHPAATATTAAERVRLHTVSRA